MRIHLIMQLDTFDQIYRFLTYYSDSDELGDTPDGMKRTFLNGVEEEEVYVEKPIGFEKQHT